MQSLQDYALPHKTSQGFTLIELMITVVIIAILAAIAIPSYRSQIQRNAEEQARQRALGVADQLAKWRSKRLSYEGFIPLNDGCGGTSNACYSDASAGQLYVPLGSTRANHRYVLTIVDANPVIAGEGADATATSVPLNSPNATGRAWKILATPNPNDSIVNDARSFYLDSAGRRCQLDKTALGNKGAGEVKCDSSLAGVYAW